MPVRGEGGEVVFPRSFYVVCSSDIFNYIRSIISKLCTQNDYLCRFLALENGPFSTTNRSTVTHKILFSAIKGNFNREEEQETWTEEGQRPLIPT